MGSGQWEGRQVGNRQVDNRQDPTAEAGNRDGRLCENYYGIPPCRGSLRLPWLDDDALFSSPGPKENRVPEFGEVTRQ